MIDYYARIAPALLPHLADRPLTRVRFPNGVDAKSFFEKNTPSHAPDWVSTVTVEYSEGDVSFPICDEMPTLIWLAQLAAIELHPFLAKAADIDRPTAVVFDLDPGAPATIVECCRVGLMIRQMLSGIGLEIFAKTSGSKGLQLYVPLNDPEITYDETKPFALAVARALESAEPDLVVSKMSKDVRGGKIFIDWSQNNASKTTVAPYSLRAKAEPTASAPVSWEEVEATAAGGDPDQLRFLGSEVLDRFEADGDLMEPVLTLQQQLPAI